MRLIDAEQAIAELKGIIGLDGSNPFVKAGLYPWNVIKTIPTADAKLVVHGKWERHYVRPGVYADMFWYCSACGGKNRDEWANMYDYCPNCGADMREVEDER